PEEGCRSGEDYGHDPWQARQRWHRWESDCRSPSAPAVGQRCDALQGHRREPREGAEYDGVDQRGGSHGVSPWLSSSSRCLSILRSRFSSDGVSACWSTRWVSNRVGEPRNIVSITRRTAVFPASADSMAG